MTLAFDPTGQSAANLIMSEQVVPTLLSNGYSFSYAILANAPAIGDSIRIKVASVANAANYKILNMGVDYEPAFAFQAAMGKTNLPVYGGVRFINTALSTLIGSTGVALGAYIVYVTYQSMGGNFAASPIQMAAILAANKNTDPTVVTWEGAFASINLSLATMPASDYAWQLANVDTVKNAIAELEKLGLVVHMRPRFLSQPNQTVYIPTAQEVGLGNVSNFPVATQAQARTGHAQSYMTPERTVDAVVYQLTQLLASMGYNVPITYTAGLPVSNPSTSYLYDGNIYVMRQGVAPFTSSGTFEYNRFVTIASLVRDTWQAVTYTVTGAENLGPSGETLAPLGTNITTRCHLHAILNYNIELVEGEEVHLDGNTLVITFPVVAGDVIKVIYKPIKSKQSDDVNVYRTFKVTAAGQQVFQVGNLQAASTSDYRVTVNDWLILDPAQGQYTLTNQGGILGYALNLAYPLQVGDVIEFENEDSLPSMGKQALRAVLLARTL